MQVTAGDKTFEIDPAEFESVTKFKELSAIEKAFGTELDKLRPMDMAAGLVWSLVKRQDATVRIDDIDFDVTALPNPEADEGKAASPSDLNESSASS